MNRFKMSIFSGLFLASCSPQYQLLEENDEVGPAPPPCTFSQIRGGPFLGYDCNPVFTTQDEPWAPSILSASVLRREINGASEFHLWYIGAPHPKDGLGDYGLGHAVSRNGAEWRASEANPLLTESDPSAWDAHNMENIQVVWDPTSQRYVMIYLGYNLSGWHTYGLGVATSPDGELWSLSPKNPVVDVYQYFESDPEWRWPTEFHVSPEGHYYGYAAGASASRFGRDIYPIQSQDLTQWSIAPTPVFETGAEGEFDDIAVLNSSTVERNGIHYLFYVGISKTEYYATSWVMGGHLGWATSKDGVRWTRGLIPEAEIEGFPSGPGPLHLRDDPTGELSHVDAHLVGDQIHLWVTDTWDGQASIGYYIFDPQKGGTP